MAGLFSMQPNHFYTYMLVDPRNGVPFYVGKGQGRRCHSHVAAARNSDKSTFKLNKIRKIESLGLAVIVRKVDESLTDALAQEFEMLIISEALDKGIQLTNLTAGGDGSAGYVHTQESLLKISQSQLGKPKPESQKKALSAYLLLNPIHARDGVSEKVSGENHWNFGKPARNKGVPMSEDQKQLLSEKTSGDKHHFFGKPCSEERREAIRAATKGVKKSTTVNMLQEKVECPHCGKVGGCRAMKQWHFDNCKGKR